MGGYVFGKILAIERQSRLQPQAVAGTKADPLDPFVAKQFFGEANPALTGMPISKPSSPV